MVPARTEIQVDEATLVARIRAGDADALEALYLRYHAALHRFAAQQTHDLDTADEVLHDVFLGLWRRRATLTIETTVSIYLFAAVRRRAAGVRVRRLRDRELYERASRAGALIGQIPRIDDQVDRADLIARVWHAVDDLPGNRRDALTLRWREQMTFEEIAVVMDTTVASVKMHVSRALRTLRDRLGDVLR